MKRRSTRTVTVFSLTSLVTTPCRTRLGIFLLSVLRGRALAFAQRRHDSRDVAAHGAHAAGVLELAARALEAQVELLLAQLGQLRVELVGRLGADVLGFHRLNPHIPSRATTLVLIGSLAAARRNASSATARDTPSISNMMRPGFTRHTQYSGEPLPEPMRTSAGLIDTGTSGKIRIHTRPSRLRWRVIVRRAASICRA